MSKKGSSAVKALYFGSVMIGYMDASRWQGFIRCDGRQIRLEVYIRPVCADRSLRALMDFADPRLISPESSKLGQSFRLSGSRSDLFTITRCSPCATFWRTFLCCGLIDRVYGPMQVDSRTRIDTPVHGPTAPRS